MRWNGVLGTVAILAVAGCITPAAIQDVPAADLEEAALAAPAELEQALVAPEQDDADASPRTVVVMDDADQTIHARAVSAHAGWSGGAELNLPRARPLNGTLTVTWASRQPLESAAEVWLSPPGGADIVQLYGMSPIVVPIPGESFGDGTSFFGWVEPGGPAGAMTLTSVHFELSVTYAS